MIDIIRQSLKQLMVPLVAMLASVYCLSSFAAETVNLEQVGRQLNIDKNKISVSGISAGAGMAHQFHVAHSAHIMGVGVVAGIPYMCAQGDLRLGIYYCTKFLKAAWDSMSNSCPACSMFTQMPVGTYRFVATNQNIPSIEVEFRGFEYVGPGDDESEKARLLARILVDQTKNLHGIDNYRNIKKANVYLFHNRHDNKIPKAMMDAVYYFYDGFGVPDAQLSYNRAPIDRALPEGHAFMIDNIYKIPFVSRCNRPAAYRESYIHDCNCETVSEIANEACSTPSVTACDVANEEKGAFCADRKEVDLAGNILRKIYPNEITNERRPLVSDAEFTQESECKKSTMNEAEWKNCILGTDKIKRFLQMNFITDKTANLESLADYGYMFVPDDCLAGQKCKLHVVFHGCEQGGVTDTYGNLFSKYTGYNEWAASNKIVVLYPQVQRSNAPVPLNGYGCYDVWGVWYTGEKYYLQEGKQISAVARMINALLGDNVFPASSD